MGVGGNNAAAGRLKASNIIFVVADEDDVLGVNLVLLTPVLETFVFAGFELMKTLKF